MDLRCHIRNDKKRQQIKAKRPTQVGDQQEYSTLTKKINKTLIVRTSMLELFAKKLKRAEKNELHLPKDQNHEKLPTTVPTR